MADLVAMLEGGPPAEGATFFVDSGDYEAIRVLDAVNPEPEDLILPRRESGL